MVLMSYHYDTAEAYASASNTAKRYIESILISNNNKNDVGEEDYSKFGAYDVFSRARSGDVIALEILEEVSLRP